MKALTIKEPWATLIIEGYKEYEFRSWKTNYRGKILIHAGMSIEKDMLEKMREIIAEQLNCDGETIGLDTSFKDDLGADSLDLFELVMALEEEYGLEIPAEELSDVETVGDIIEYLKNKGVED